MKRPVLLAISGLSLVLGIAYGKPDQADASASRPARTHVWGRFGTGSWKQVRVVTESLNSEGTVTASSVSEKRITLCSITDRNYKLTIEGTVEVGGKKLEAPVQELSEGFFGQPADQEVAVQEIETDSVTIDGQEYPCRVEQVEVVTGKNKTITKSWIAEDVAPYVLRRETKVLDPDTGKAVEETTQEVVALKTRRTILRRLRTTAEIHVVQTSTKGSTVTQRWHSDDIPGGVVGERTEEFDAEKHLLRRSQLELVDYASK